MCIIIRCVLSLDISIKSSLLNYYHLALFNVLDIALISATLHIFQFYLSH